MPTTVDNKDMTLPVDHVVVCAGQELNRGLQTALQAQGVHVDLIGGADKAAEFDVKRTIKQDTELALHIELI
jgi:2,4-dienoyl-CoA reductase (NADPH2)